MTSRSLSSLLRRYLITRLLLPGILFVLGIAALLGWQRWVEIQSNQDQQALMVSEYVATYLGFAAEVVNLLVEVGPTDFAAVAAGYREHSRSFERIILLSEGGVVLEAFPPMGGMRDYSRILPGHRESEQIVHVSSPYLAPLSNNLTVSLFSKVKDGRLVVGELNLLALQNFIASLGQVSQDELVFITDIFGNVLAHPDRNVVNQQTNLGNLAPVVRGTGGETGFLGVHVMQGSHHLFSMARVHGSDWFVFTAWNVKKQSFPVLVMLAMFAVTLHLLLLTTVWLLKRKLDLEVSRPLTGFAQAMDRLERGDGEGACDAEQLHVPFEELRLLNSRFKDMAAAIRQREKALRSSEERFRNLADALPESVFEMDLFCVLKYANRNTLDRFGYTSKDFEAGLNLMDLVVTQERTAVFTHAERLLHDEEAPPLEFTALCRDGSTFPAQLHASAILIHDRPRGVRGFIIDMTRVKQEQGQRLAVERHLLHAQKLESLGILAGGVAHDFNNLLAAIQGNLDLALLSVPETSPGHARIRQAGIAVRRASELTRQMLAYSGKGRFLVQGINLNDFVRENVSMFQAVISKTITLDLRLAPDLPEISADFGQLQQVVMNLLTNASEAMGELPGTMTLTTSVVDCDEDFLAKSRVLEKPDPGRYVSLEVRDTGSGMDAQTMEHLFDPFYTTKFTGRGLGLAAVLGIVQGHGGAILVDSRLGEGTTFQVLFPAVSSSGERNQTQISESGNLESQGADRTGRSWVLVVDDEAMVRDVCVEVLEYLGYQTLSAMDGEEGVRLFQEHAERIGCVILDLTMPKMNGVAALKAMRKINPEIKIILCSGYNEQEAVRYFLDESPTLFLKKPFSVQELSEVLTRIMV